MWFDWWLLCWMLSTSAYVRATSLGPVENPLLGTGLISFLSLLAAL